MLLLSSAWIFSLSVGAQANIFQAFPYECEMASDRQALPGHFLRVGFVSNTNNGLAFFFPDERIQNNLQMVPIGENAGLIGIGAADLNMWRMTTPPGSFTVAQIFVGDQDAEPMVTCLSRPILLTQYVPMNYGYANVWLDRVKFGNYLKWRKYSKWNWRDRWQRDIYKIRSDRDYRSHYRTKFDRLKSRNWYKNHAKYNDRNDRFDRRRDSDRNNRWDRNAVRDGKVRKTIDRSTITKPLIPPSNVRSSDAWKNRRQPSAVRQTQERKAPAAAIDARKRVQKKTQGWKKSADRNPQAVLDDQRNLKK